MAEPHLSPPQRARLLALITERPGRTVDEHEAAAGKVADRLTIRFTQPPLTCAFTMGPEPLTPPSRNHVHGPHSVPGN